MIWMAVISKILYLQHEESGMEDAGIDEDGAELATLEQFVGLLEEEVVRIQHDNPLVLDQAPCIELVQGELKSPVEIVLARVRVVKVVHSLHLRPILLAVKPRRK